MFTRRLTLAVLLVALAQLGLTSCAHSRKLVFADDPGPVDPKGKDRSRCDSKPSGNEINNVRACLVPDEQGANKTKGEVASNCYWRDVDFDRIRYHLGANDRHRRFTFEIINLCSLDVPVTMRFEGAGSSGADIEFITAACGPRTAVVDITLRPGQNALVACDTIRYRRQPGGRVLSRVFSIHAGAKKIEFDPEIVLKDAG